MHEAKVEAVCDVPSHRDSEHQEQKGKGYSITQCSFTLSKWLLQEPLGPQGEANGILEITTQWRGVVSPR